MKKKILLRSLLGFPMGVALGYGITILISCMFAGGEYAPCMPELTAVMGSEIKAVVLQALLCGILGGGFAAASVIWEMEDWPLVKQTGIYFGVVSILMMPIAYVTHWMEHSLTGLLSYFGIFLGLFALIWIVQYGITRRNVKKWNNRLRQAREDQKE